MNPFLTLFHDPYLEDVANINTGNLDFCVDRLNLFWFYFLSLNEANLIKKIVTIYCNLLKTKDINWFKKIHKIVLNLKNDPCDLFHELRYSFENYEFNYFFDIINEKGSGLGVSWIDSSFFSVVELAKKWSFLNEYKDINIYYDELEHLKKQKEYIKNIPLINQNAGKTEVFVGKIKEIEFVDSKKNFAIQLSDIISGFIRHWVVLNKLKAIHKLTDVQQEKLIEINLAIKKFPNDTLFCQIPDSDRLSKNFINFIEFNSKVTNLLQQDPFSFEIFYK
tara:strand:+ start:137 stop:970 length:834 start_codon:yes stop_codon:yes gene_type:complete